MTWNNIKVNNVLLFCEDWKSREEIAEEFGLTPIESWHCVRWLGKLKHEVIVEKRVGRTGRKYMYKTRKFILQDIKEGKKASLEITKERMEELSEASERPMLDGEEKKSPESGSDVVTMQDIEKAKETIKDAEHEDDTKNGIEQAIKETEPEFTCPYCGSPAIPDPEEPEVFMCSNKECKGKELKPKVPEPVEEDAGYQESPEEKEKRLLEENEALKKEGMLHDEYQGPTGDDPVEEKSPAVPQEKPADEFDF